MINALIFDVDGTLAETEELHRQAFNDSFSALGLNWYWSKECYRDLLKVTGGKERMTHYVKTAEPKFAHDFLPRIAEIHEVKTDRYNQLVESGRLSLRPGVERLLHDAREDGLHLAIATTTSRPNVTTLLESTLGKQSLSWFDCICAGDEVKHKKPAPDVYLNVLDSLNVDAADCVAFEDTANGLRAAAQANLHCVITVSEYSIGEDFTGALSIVSHLGEDVEPLQHLGGLAPADGLVDIACLKSWFSTQITSA